MSTVRSASDVTGRGLIVSSGPVGRAGTVITPSGGMMWLGGVTPESGTQGPGFFVVDNRDEKAVLLALREGRDAPGITMSETADTATVQVRARQSGAVAFAVKSDSGGTVVVKDRAGTDLVRLPAR